MTERDRVIKICRELRLPDDQWVVNGSGSMIMHGITAEERGKPMGDLDLFVATRVWFDILKNGYINTRVIPRYRHRDWKVWTTDPTDPRRRSDPPYLDGMMYGLPVNIFHEWRRREVGNFDVAFYIYNATVIDGVRCAPLQFILDWKTEVGRAKDVDDIRVLQRVLEA